MNWSKLYWAIVGATVVAYGVLVAIVGAEQARLTGQPIPFDFALQGDPFDFAKAYLANLTDHAAQHYANVVKPVDTIFPILFGVVLVWPILERQKSGMKAMAIFGVAYVGFDLAENAAILQMFQAKSDVTEELARYARLLTILKFTTFTIALYCLWRTARLRPKRKGTRRK